MNRKLAAVSAFYLFSSPVRGRRATGLGRLGSRRPTGAGSYERMLSHLGDQPMRHSVVRLPTQRVTVRVLKDDDVRQLVAACERLRDRFLLLLLAGLGHAGWRSAWVYGMRTLMSAVRECCGAAEG